MARVITEHNVTAVVRNAEALRANFYRFERESLEAVEDAVVISANVCVRHIKQNCARDTGYMADHTTAHWPSRRA